MRILLEREIDRLKKLILGMSAEVESEVHTACNALLQRDDKTAQALIDDVDKVDTMELDVEEECLKILALHQPVAADLRYIVSVMKINRDLERISDIAVHMAERTLKIFAEPDLLLPAQLSDMSVRVQAMLKKVLDAFVRLDVEAARNVCMADSEVDTLNREVLRQVKEGVLRKPEQFDALLQVMHVSRHLERIADHATNIAEDLIYMVEGRIVRHSPEVSDKG
ncbi:MAG: phosphate signaling complex protein PhoU [Lentisphaerae bacterium]|nr:phosphate signaling complex protein PhoU [Lentisphaerota bacterium]